MSDSPEWCRRQACAYGAGVAAKIPAFRQYATQAVTRVVNGIQDPKAAPGAAECLISQDFHVFSKDSNDFS